MTSTKFDNSLNLLEDSLQPLTHWEKIYIWINHTAKYILILAEIALVFTFLLHMYYDTRLSALKDNINKEVQLLQSRRKQETKMVIVVKSLQELEKLNSNNVSVAERQQYILSLVPKGITISSFQLNFNTVSLNGTANNYDTLKVLFDNFNNAKQLNKDSIITSTSQVSKNNIHFNLTCDFK